MVTGPTAQTNDQSYREVVLVALVVLATTVVVPFLEPLGRAHVEGLLAKSTWVPFAVVAVILMLAGAKVWDQGRNTSSALWISGGAMIMLGVALAMTALSYAAPTLKLESYASALVAAGSLAAAAVPLGFSIHGVFRGLEELTGSQRNRGYGVVLLVMSLVGLGTAYQLGRRPVRQLLAGSMSVVPQDEGLLRRFSCATSRPSEARSSA